MEKKNQIIWVKIFVIIFVSMLLISFISAGRSQPNPLGRSRPWGEETTQTTPPTTDDPLREKNNLYIQSLMNKSSEPLVQQEEPTLKEIEETIEQTSPYNLSAKQNLENQKEVVENNFDIIIFYGAGVLLFILFIWVVGWLKSKGRDGI